MKTVSACETQPISAEGLRAVVGRCPGLGFGWTTETLGAAARLVREQPPAVLVIDKGFGVQTLLSWIAETRSAGVRPELAVWGVTVSESEALRLLQIGVRGILRKTAPPHTVVACLRAVAEGTSWIEETLFQDQPRRERNPHSELTPREQQVLDLVEQGLKNKEIARELGIRPGTVKIHLKHIFEKTGVRGRYGLALSGLQDRGMLELPRFQ